jgi:twitching motility two-component system response regulator PilH
VDPSPDQSNSAQPLKAIVVDDVARMREHVIELLAGLGISCAEAANGVEALDRLGREAFDLVFTDLVMPEMDGFELCEEIRRQPSLRKLPVVVTSSHRDSEYMIRALRKGADDYLTKPTSRDLLEKVIARVMCDV